MYKILVFCDYDRIIEKFLKNDYRYDKFKLLYSNNYMSKLVNNNKEITIICIYTDTNTRKKWKTIFDKTKTLIIMCFPNIDQIDDFEERLANLIDGEWFYDKNINIITYSENIEKYNLKTFKTTNVTIHKIDRISLEAIMIDIISKTSTQKRRRSKSLPNISESKFDSNIIRVFSDNSILY